jgi:hypothetical protein
VTSVPASYLTNSVFNKYGRFSAYGAPTDIKVLSDVTKSQTRFIEVVFSVLTASGADSPRRGIIAATQPNGSNDAIMLVSTSTTARWKKSGADQSARQAAESFRIVGTRTTNAARAPSADYRFGTEGQSSVEKRINVEGEGTARFSTRFGAEWHYGTQRAGRCRTAQAPMLPRRGGVRGPSASHVDATLPRRPRRGARSMSSMHRQAPCDAGHST